MTDIPKITLKEYITCTNYRKSLDLYNRSKQKALPRKTYLQINNGPRVKSQALIQKQVKQINIFIRSLVKQDYYFSQFQHHMAQLLRIFVRQISYLRSSNNTMNSMMRMSCARPQGGSNMRLAVDQHSRFNLNMNMQQSVYTKYNCHQNDHIQENKSYLKSDNNNSKIIEKNKNENAFQVHINTVQKPTSKRLKKIMQNSNYCEKSASFLEPPKDRSKSHINSLNSLNSNNNNSYFHEMQFPPKLKQQHKQNLFNSALHHDYNQYENIQDFIQSDSSKYELSNNGEPHDDQFDILNQSLPEQSYKIIKKNQQNLSQKVNSKHQTKNQNNSIGTEQLNSSSIINKASLYKKDRSSQSKFIKKSRVQDEINNQRKNNKNCLNIKNQNDQLNNIKKSKRVNFNRNAIQENIGYQLKAPPFLLYDNCQRQFLKQKTLDESYITQSTMKNDVDLQEWYDSNDKKNVSKIYGLSIFD